nr:skin secretory protein xP2-like [Macaca nemestrina]XP_024643268.1 skin secretory protein xP2-like [Macaca nemestrina]
MGQRSSTSTCSPQHNRGWSRAWRGTAPVLKALVRPLHSAGGAQGAPQGLHGASILPESQRPPTGNSFTAPPARAAPSHSKGPSGKASELPASGHAAWQAGFAPRLRTRGSDGGAGALVQSRAPVAAPTVRAQPTGGRSSAEKPRSMETSRDTAAKQPFLGPHPQPGRETPPAPPHAPAVPVAPSTWCRRSPADAAKSGPGPRKRPKGHFRVALGKQQGPRGAEPRPRQALPPPRPD